ncbi:MAG: hypothetical protein KBD01_15550 [Acidobacteria bacterium]|nr:hypothetical protein [Acidobacteriota bacterium]
MDRASKKASAERPSIFECLTTYHRNLDRMMEWLEHSGLSHVDRVAIADAWQDDMRAWFREQGYCFACNRELGRCRCA